VAAMWFKERININANEFHWLFGRSYSNAWAILGKVRTVQKHNLPEAMLNLPSALFMDSFCKRSKETPRRGHPQSEEGDCVNAEASKQNSGPRAGEKQADSSPNVVPNEADLTDAQKNIYQHILEEPVSADLLCHVTGVSGGEISVTLIELLLGGFIKEYFGNRFARVPKPVIRPSDCGKDEQNAVKVHAEFLRWTHYYGVSRKYMQNYLSDFVVHSQPENWAGGVLTDICLRFRHVGIKEIMAYVTPAIVQILPVPLASTN